VDLEIVLDSVEHALRIRIELRRGRLARTEEVSRWQIWVRTFSTGRSGRTAETTASRGSTERTPSGATLTRTGLRVAGQTDSTRPGLAQENREHQRVGRAPAVQRPPLDRELVRRRPERYPESDQPALLIPFSRGGGPPAPGVAVRHLGRALCQLSLHRPPRREPGTHGRGVGARSRGGVEPWTSSPLSSTGACPRRTG
jgi:hypothetical protein